MTYDLQPLPFQQEKALAIAKIIAGMITQIDALRNALEGIVALDDGDEPYWWGGKEEEALQKSRAALSPRPQERGMNRNPTLTQIGRELTKCPKQKEVLVAALRMLYEEQVDYITLNHLGDPHHNQSMQMARAALAAAQGDKHE